MQLTIAIQLLKNLTIKAPPQKVFAYWSDFHNFQELIPIIESIEVLNDKGSRWVISTPLAHKVAFASLITTLARFLLGERLVKVFI